MKKVILGLLTLTLIFGLVTFINAAIDQNDWQVHDDPVFSGENRAYYPSVLKIGGTYHMWYTDTDSGGDYVVGYTTSSDGSSWDTPTTVTGLTGTPNHVVVLNIGSETSPNYRIWYADASKWPYDIELFRTAESSDGINWGNDRLMESDSEAPLFTNVHGTWWYGSYGPGAVLYNADGYEVINNEDPMGNKYVMYYDVYSSYEGTQENTALAYSVDGINWKRYGDEPVIFAEGDSSFWDAGYLYAWSVLKLEDGYHMWYSGGVSGSNKGIGYAYSVDGLEWEKDSENPLLHATDEDAQDWRQERTYTPMVLLDCDESEWKMYFSAVDGTKASHNKYAIGLATMEADETVCPIIDDIPPVITFEEPIDGSIHKGIIHLKATCDETCDYINFWWRAENESYGEYRYHYIHDDGTVFEWDLNTLNAEKANGNFYKMDDGFYYLYAAGKDLAGNWARTLEIRIEIDNTAPIISNITAEPDKVSHGDTIIVIATVVDEGSGVKAVSADFFYEEGGRPSPTSVAMHKTGSDSDEFRVEYVVPDTWDDGTMKIHVAARDKLDNYTRSSEYEEVLVDNTPAPIDPPTDKEQCMKDRWKLFDSPVFRNQGQCVSYVQANEKAGKR